jgi:hypothetical protein
VGGWSPAYDWPAVAIHLHLLRDGRILSEADDTVVPDFRGADLTGTFATWRPLTMCPQTTRRSTDLTTFDPAANT